VTAYKSDATSRDSSSSVTEFNQYTLLYDVRLLS